MSFTYHELPLLPSLGAQTFRVDLGGTTYRLSFSWSRLSNCWIMDVLDASDAPILRGVPLVTGTDLLGQFAYLDIGGGGHMVTLTKGNLDAPPTYANLGDDGKLYWVEPF